jgi:hypothetical protein
MDAGRAPGRLDLTCASAEHLTLHLGLDVSDEFTGKATDR